MQNALIRNKLFENVNEIKLKHKIKPTDDALTKKVKNQKKTSPQQKPKIKKDTNIHLISKAQSSNTYLPTHRTSSKSKSKSKSKDVDKQKLKQKSKNTKKIKSDQQPKQLTTSPIFYHKEDRSTSRDKSHSKSRSKSIINTNRQISKTKKQKKSGKEKQNKFVKSQFERSASRSRSIRLLTERDITPIKQALRRTISPQKNASGKKQKKKNLQLKINLSPSQQFEQVEVAMPKMKLKKHIPQIKTDFSQRKNSFFDQELLRKLNLDYNLDLKLPESCFPRQSAAKVEEESQNLLKSESNHQPIFTRSQQNEKDELNILNVHSKSDMKIYESTHFQSNLRSNDYGSIRQELQMKWRMMLLELTNLKNQEKIPQKIDKIIEELNQNYIHLQEVQMQLSKKQEIPYQHHQNHTDINENEYKAQQKQYKIDQNQCKTQQKQISIKQKRNPIDFQKISQNKLEKIEQERQDKKQQDLTMQKISLDSQFFASKASKKLEFEIKQSSNNSFNNLLLSEDHSQTLRSDLNLLKDLQIAHSSFQEKSQSINKVFDNFFDQDLNCDFIANKAQGPSDFIFFNEIQGKEIQNIEAIDGNQKVKNYIINELQNWLYLQFCQQIIQSKAVLHNFLIIYDNVIQNKEFKIEEFKYNCSNTFILEIVKDFIEFIENEKKLAFMKHINIDVSLNPKFILKAMRLHTQQEQDESNSSELINYTFINSELVEEFQLTLLTTKNKSIEQEPFLQVVYQCLNQCIQMLHPFSKTNKSVNSLKLSHAPKNFQIAKSTLVKDFQRILNKQDLLEWIDDSEDQQVEEKYVTAEILFEQLLEECCFEIFGFQK